ncbi:hypothetical protein QE152_g9920 [Popillia japonica]|uniref:Gag-like protein n=1 Tax=Popillia japonica TaxID=7064 RepID=A0AAW1LWQ0_POPJA
MDNISQADPVKKDPFARRDILQRSPPRARAGSMSEIEDRMIAKGAEKMCQQPSKRKRGDDVEDATVDKPNVDQYRRALAEIFKQVTRLEKALADMYKPKQELKDIASKLVLETEKLQDTDFAKWVDQVTIEGQALKKQNEELVMQLRELEGKSIGPADPKVRNLVAHCEECVKAKNKGERRSRLTIKKNCEECVKAKNKGERRSRLTIKKNYEMFQSISEDDWLEDIFPKLVEHPDGIWDAPVNYQIALPCNRRTPRRHLGCPRKLSNCTPLKTETSQKQSVSCTIPSSRTENQIRKPTTKSTKRYLYYPIIADGKPDKETDDKDMYQALETVKQLMNKNGKTNLAVPEMEGVVGTIFNRMVKYLFHDTNIKVEVYTDQNAKPTLAKSQTRETRREPIGGKPSINPVVGGVKRTRQNKGDTILVKMQGRSYADLLRTIKKKVNPGEIGVDLAGVRETRNGELLLTVQNGSDKAEILRQEIKEKCPEATAINKAEILRQEIKEKCPEATAINKTEKWDTRVKPDTFEVRALRPAFGSRQNATIITPTAIGEKLLQMSKIKIGWMKCGNACQNESYCVHCQEVGHQSGSRRCPKSGKMKDGASSSQNERGNSGGSQNQDDPSQCG